MEGSCKYCSGKTRSDKTKLCDACFKLSVCIQNNPEAARLMIEEFLKGLNKDESFGSN